MTKPTRWIKGEDELRYLLPQINLVIKKKRQEIAIEALKLIMRTGKQALPINDEKLEVLYKMQQGE